MKPTNNLLVIILAIMASVFTTNRVLANDRTTAVLQHGETSTAYYGPSAFADAMSAAQTGDAIYLSQGVFTQTTIDKAVKIVGSGVATLIDGSFEINLPDGEKGLDLEGVQFNGVLKVNSNLESAVFKRCRFTYASYNIYFYKNNIDNSFIQCRNDGIINVHYYSNAYSAQNVIFTNCLLKEIMSIRNTDNVSFKNCVINEVNSDAGNLENCIIRNNNSNRAYLSYKNTIVPSDATNKINTECPQENVTFLTKSEIAALFAETTNFTLTDGAAATYLGTDGKQVGVYGGAYPYTLVPAIPMITSSKVSPMVGEDGKLNVTITAEANN